MNAVSKPKAVKLTKKLHALFRRWNTPIRKAASTVTHVLTKRRTEVDPVTFAAFETAIKAVYASNMAAKSMRDQGFDDYLQQLESHYSYIAELHGFSLPAVDDKTDSRKCADDYHYCCDLITKAGLYMQLLD